MNKPQCGNLLIAPPVIPDPRFNRTVMMVTQADSIGAFALCLNKPTGHSLQEILTDTGLDINLSFPLYWGGPVGMSSLWMLHSTDWNCEHTVAVDDRWSLTSHISMFYHLADGDVPEHFRLMLGYASWTKGQLEAEMRGLAPWTPSHSWLVASGVDPEWVYEQPVEDLWLMSTDLCCHQAVDTWL